MKRLFLWLIDWYRTCVSPYKGGSCCRFVPTCSEYGRTAVERFGAVKGGLMTAWRILRCNPFSKGGYDPVPEKKDRTGKKRPAEGAEDPGDSPSEE